MVELLVVIAIIGMLVMLLVPGVEKVRRAAARAQVTNNLKELGIGIFSYQDAYKYLPTTGNGWGSKAELRDTGNWGFQILPFLDKASLTDVANGTSNQQQMLFQIPVFCDPLRGRAGWITDIESNNPPTFTPATAYGPTSDFAYNLYLLDYDNGGSVSPGVRRVSVQNIPDGQSNTIMLGEKWWPSNWYDKTDFRDQIPWGRGGQPQFINPINQGGLRLYGNEGPSQPGPGLEFTARQDYDVSDEIAMAKTCGSADVDNPCNFGCNGAFGFNAAFSSNNAGSWGGPVAEYIPYCMADGSVRLIPVMDMTKLTKANDGTMAVPGY